MREIKFRCWDTGINYMYYDTEGYNTYNENDNGLHSGYEDKYGMWHQNILMQYTGLRDKNGVDIYEGDIFYDDWDNHIGVVNFVNGMFITESYLDGFENSTLEPCDNREYLIARLQRDCGVCLEVIGNIYENHELLEQK